MAAGWTPRRGDAVWDTAKRRAGVVIAIPEDTGTHVYHVCPPNGGEAWVARLDDLQPHEDDAPDGMTLNESVMPPPGLIPHPWPTEQRSGHSPAPPGTGFAP